MSWHEAVINGSTTQIKLFDNAGNQIAEVRCLAQHKMEILEAWEGCIPKSHQKALALAGYISRIVEPFTVGECRKIHKRAKAISAMVRRGK